MIPTLSKDNTADSEFQYVPSLSPVPSLANIMDTLSSVKVSQLL